MVPVDSASFQLCLDEAIVSRTVFMIPPGTKEEWILQQARGRPAAERAAFLEGACAGDAALRERVEALLAGEEQTETRLATQAEDVRPREGASSFPKASEEASARQARPTIRLDLADAPDEAVGQTLGRYKLLERVGEGGCGVVYVAEQTEPVRRRVALKVIKLGMDTKQVVARFEAERQALAMMDHPNIAKVLDAGTTGMGRPYFVMELVRGIRITEYCDQANLGTKDRLDLFIKVCQAIQHAHQKGIIHRDIKPSNILVTLHDGVPVPKVIDFGIAKATEGRLTDSTVYTQLHQFIGTPAYMSPEQAEMSGLDIDTRSDIYSLGVLLYELLAGSTPFDAKELQESGIDAMRRTIREKDPPRPSARLAMLASDQLSTAAKTRSADASKLMNQLKGDLDWIVMKCLEKDRTRRYDTANGLAADLKRYLTSEAVLARPPSAAYQVRKFVHRNRGIVTAAATIAAVLVLGICASLWEAVVASRARDAEKQQRLAAQTERDKAQAAEKEAQRQHAQAEGLIEFMLGDLRKKLEPVGRLEVLDSVGAKVLDYYAKQDPESLDAPALGRRARAQHLIGEISSLRGNSEEALVSFRSAAAATAQALARAPGDGQRVFDHAQSVFWVGYVAWQRRQGEAAEAAFLEYRDLAHRLTQIDPSNADWQVETAYAEQNLGVVRLDRGQAADALTSFESTRRVYEVLIASRPNLAFELADSLGWAANAKRALGDFDGAIEILQARGAAIGRIPDAERSRKVQQDADNAYRIAGLYLDLGRLDLAKAAVQEAMEKTQSLVALDGSNFFWLNMLCTHRLRMATILLALGERDSIGRSLEQLSTDMDRLLASDPAARGEHVSLLGESLALKSRWAQASDKPAPVAAMQSYVAEIPSMQAAGKHLSVEENRIVARVELALGDELARLGKEEQAHDHWVAAKTRLPATAAAAQFEEVALLAWAEFRLGRRSEAVALADQLLHSKFRHPAYVELLNPLVRGAGAVQPKPDN